MFTESTERTLKDILLDAHNETYNIPSARSIEAIQVRRKLNEALEALVAFSA